jgi:hypothetical protein
MNQPGQVGPGFPTVRNPTVKSAASRQSPGLNSLSATSYSSFQVLTPLAKRSIMGTTEADPDSIMCYQLPGEIMKDGKAGPGGDDINEQD